MTSPSRAQTAFDLVYSFVATFHPRHLRPMLRANYARELASWTLMPVMLTGINAGAMSVILKKTFSDAPGTTEAGLALAVATIGAATAVGNLTSTFWANLACGRSKVRLIVLLMLGCSASVGLIALIPATGAGAWMMAGLVLVGWIFWSGVITTRAAVWRANYPSGDRTMIAGRLASVQAVISATSVLVLAEVLDAFASESAWGTRALGTLFLDPLQLERIDEYAFRIIFPTLAVFGAVGAMVYARVRLRGQSRLSRIERRSRKSAGPLGNPFGAFRVLRSNPAYCRYIISQFVFGTGNLLMIPVLALVLDETFGASYLAALMITAIIPPVLMPVAIPLWARLLGRMHAVLYRAIHSWVFVLAALCFLAGTLSGQYWVMVVGAVVLGFGWGGGVLAWNLGHQHFAPPEEDAQYMSVHVALTGVRGIIAPYLGVTLYEALRPGAHDAWVFGIAALITGTGAMGFVVLRRLDRALHVVPDPGPTTGTP